MRGQRLPSFQKIRAIAAGAGTKYAIAATEPLCDSIYQQQGLVVTPDVMLRLRNAAGGTAAWLDALKAITDPDPESSRPFSLETTDFSIPGLRAFLSDVVNDTGARNVAIEAELAACKKGIAERDLRIQGLTGDNRHKDIQIERLKGDLADARENRPLLAQQRATAEARAQAEKAQQQLMELRSRFLALSRSSAGQQMQLEQALKTNDTLKGENAGLKSHNRTLASAVRRLARGQEPAKVFEAPHIQRMARKPDEEIFPALVELPEWVAARLEGRLVLHRSAVSEVRVSNHPTPERLFRALAFLAGPYRDMRLDSGNAARLEKYDTGLMQLQMRHGPSMSPTHFANPKWQQEYSRVQDGRNYLCDWHLARNNKGPAVLRVYHSQMLTPEKAVFVGHAPSHLRNTLES